MFDQVRQRWNETHSNGGVFSNGWPSTLVEKVVDVVSQVTSEFASAVEGHVHTAASENV